MGNKQSSTQSFHWEDQYRVIERHSNNVLLLHRKGTDQTHFGRQIIASNKEDSLDLERLIEAKNRNPSPFLTRIENWQANKTQKYCSTQQKYHILFQNPGTNLRDEVASRRQSGCPFSEEEVIYLLERGIQGIKYLKQLPHPHENICQSSFFLNSHGQILLGDPWITAPERQLHRHSDAHSFPSFQRLSYREQVLEKYDPFESDLFSLGCVALEIICGQSMDIIYNKNCTTISEYTLTSKINQIRHEQLKLMVRKLCSKNQEERLGIYSIFNERRARLRGTKTLQGRQSRKQPVNYVQLGLEAQKHRLWNQGHHHQQRTQIQNPQFQHHSQIHRQQFVHPQNLQKQYQIPPPIYQQPKHLRLNKTHTNFYNPGITAPSHIPMDVSSFNKSVYPPHQRERSITIGNQRYTSNRVSHYQTPNLTTNPASYYGNRLSLLSNPAASIESRSLQKPNATPYQPSKNTEIKISFGGSSYNNNTALYLENRTNSLVKYDTPIDTKISERHDLGNYKLESLTGTNKFEPAKLSQYEPKKLSPPKTKELFTFGRLFDGDILAHNTSFRGEGLADKLAAGKTDKYDSIYASNNSKNKAHIPQNDIEHKFNNPFSDGSKSDVKVDNFKLIEEKINAQIKEMMAKRDSKLMENKAANSPVKQMNKSQIDMPSRIESQIVVTDKVASNEGSRVLEESQKQKQEAESPDESEEKVSTPPHRKPRKEKYKSTIKQVSEEEFSGDENEAANYQYVVEEYDVGSRYDGYKSNGKREGRGKFFYKEGSYYDGEWKDNKMHGRGTLYYANGKIAYDGDWFMDEFSGQGKVFNDEKSQLKGPFDYTDFYKLEQNWEYYEGQLLSDARHGKGTIKLINGETFIGSFDKDKVHGDGKFFTLSGEVINGRWKNNRLIETYNSTESK